MNEQELRSTSANAKYILWNNWIPASESSIMSIHSFIHSIYSSTRLNSAKKNLSVNGLSLPKHSLNSATRHFSSAGRVLIPPWWIVKAQLALSIRSCMRPFRSSAQTATSVKTAGPVVSPFFAPFISRSKYNRYRVWRHEEHCTQATEAKNVRTKGDYWESIYFRRRRMLCVGSSVLAPSGGADLWGMKYRRLSRV